MANRIRELREERGMPVSAFALAVRVSERTVRNWEAGDTDPTQRNARRIARALGVNVHQSLPTKRLQHPHRTGPPKPRHLSP